MGSPKLKAEVRDTIGRRKCKKIRKKGFVPAVVYGHNKETKEIKVEEVELEKVLNRHGYKTTIDLEIDGKVVTTIIKEVQRHITKDNFLHIDFQQLSKDEKIKLQVPINLIGREKVESSTSIFQQQLVELDIQCLPKNIVKSIDVDISELKFGEYITVSDLNIPEDSGVEVLNNPNEIIGTLTSTTKQTDDTEQQDTPIYESSKSILDI
ncbi:50S ribosomal protein L25 [Caldisalinibacter kiritimatiensis]|uniref:Large ribosomal subunit protein bL25 n=1 Tax=Caldisalinibacter kiritimatiensis TaxID=1304284 RepID=R1ATW9_9FIRM|nr:50S ribosomal protein L25 [Caldisalinibacter kiritimatiensis]EOD00578.1 LSU ribosomal protein L25p [Caldisalinibacter kiritimatiensis]